MPIIWACPVPMLTKQPIRRLPNTALASSSTTRAGLLQPKSTIDERLLSSDFDSLEGGCCRCSASCFPYPAITVCFMRLVCPEKHRDVCAHVMRVSGTDEANKYDSESKKYSRFDDRLTFDRLQRHPLQIRAIPSHQERLAPRI